MRRELRQILGTITVRLKIKLRLCMRISRRGWDTRRRLLMLRKSAAIEWHAMIDEKTS